MTITITTDMLAEARICQEGIDAFDRHCPGGLPWTGEGLSRAIAFAEEDPDFDLEWALILLDLPPSDDTREAALATPYSAYLYARDVDKAPRGDTRAAVLADPHYASRYIRDFGQ